jgi:hypothetical protein
VLDEDLPHGPRGRSEQVTPVHDLVEDGVAQQPDHGLVDHPGGREGMIGPLPPHQARRDLAQLLVDQRDDFTSGPLITGPGPTEDEREFVRLPGSHDSSFDKAVEVPPPGILRGTHREDKERKRRRTDSAGIFSGHEP